MQPFGFTPRQIVKTFLGGFSLTARGVLFADNIALLKASR
jgi:hypothetical protein